MGRSRPEVPGLTGAVAPPRFLDSPGAIGLHPVQGARVAADCCGRKQTVPYATNAATGSAAEGASRHIESGTERPPDGEPKDIGNAHSLGHIFFATSLVAANSGVRQRCLRCLRVLAHDDTSKNIWPVSLGLKSLIYGSPMPRCQEIPNVPSEARDERATRKARDDKPDTPHF